MVDATEPAIFEPAIAEIRPSMGAMQTEQSDAALILAKKDEIFPERSNRERGSPIGQFLRERHRLPITAQKSSGWSPGANPGQQLVLFLSNHVVTDLRYAAAPDRCVSAAPPASISQ